MPGDPLLLRGAVVQRVDAGPKLVLLRLRAPGTNRWVLIAAGFSGQAVGVLDEKPWKGASLPGGSVSEGPKLRLRRRIEGARIEEVGPRRIVLSREEDRFALSAESRPDGEVTIEDLGDEEDPREDAARALAEEAWIAEGERLARQLGEGALAGQRQALARSLARATARIGRRVTAIKKDLARIEEADALAAQAALFVAEAARAPRGCRELVVTDWTTGEPLPRRLALDPARTARDQVDAMFKRARRLKLGAVIARRRLAEAEDVASKLARVAAKVSGEGTLEGIEALGREARAAAPRDFALAQGASPPGGARGGASGKLAPNRPYRTYYGNDGDRILVGRGAAHNDALTLHCSKPHDLWLHAKGQAGAHVIVPLEKNHPCDSDLLVDAAHLAAHFSDAREETVVDIEYTPRRYLRKPRGSAPGFVIVDREKVLVLRVEPERLARLLASEDVGTPI